MKIGIVLPSVPGYSETFFTSKIKGLQDNGFEIILFVNKFSTKTSLNCTIVASPTFSKNKLKSIFISFYIVVKVLVFHFSNVKRLFLLNQKDNFSFIKNLKNIIINSHLLTQKLDWLHFGFGTMAIDRENVAEAIRAKMAVSFRGFDHYVFPLKNKDCYKLLFSKKVKYHVLSYGMQNDLLKQSVSADKICKITPAINNQLFFRNFKHDENTNFLTVARLHWIKGLDYILESLSILHKKGIDFRYTIIGEGNEKEKLLYLIHQFGIGEKVILLGKLNPEEVKYEMEKSTYYIQYSLQEGFCNAVIEAQAMGLICLVSDADGLSENVMHNQTGFVVPKRNPELFANKIIETILLSNQEKEYIITNAVDRINSIFTIENQIKQFVNFYNNN